MSTENKLKINDQVQRWRPSSWPSKETLKLISEHAKRNPKFPLLSVTPINKSESIDELIKLLNI